MKINHILIFFIFVLFIIGCSAEITSFEKGIKEMAKINKKYSVDFKSIPNTMENAVLLRNDLKQISGMGVNAPESFNLFLDYRIKSIESNIIHLEAWKEGMKASTRDGFGCKSLPIVVNSSILRNISAQKGYEAIKVLQEFVDKYPEEALTINITQRDIVFTNLYYYEIEREAKRDRTIIEHFCGNKTNEINKTNESG